MVIFHLEQLDTVTKTQHFLFCFVCFVFYWAFFFTKFIDFFFVEQLDPVTKKQHVLFCFVFYWAFFFTKLRESFIWSSWIQLQRNNTFCFVLYFTELSFSQNWKNLLFGAVGSSYKETTLSVLFCLLLSFTKLRESFIWSSWIQLQGNNTFCFVVSFTDFFPTKVRKSFIWTSWIVTRIQHHSVWLCFLALSFTEIF